MLSQLLFLKNNSKGVFYLANSQRAKLTFIHDFKLFTGYKAQQYAQKLYALFLMERKLT